VRYVDEYRDPALARSLAAEIRALVTPGEVVRVMEICGGHTHAIYRHGLEELLPPEVELVHGPGCPVCVIDGTVDDAIAIARTGVTARHIRRHAARSRRPRLITRAKARGADVRMVSPASSGSRARREVVFFAVGFETTAPATAVTLLRARADGIANFSAFVNHVTIVPPLRAILDSPGLQLDAFIAPGHVSTVIGTHPYDFIPAEYGKPVVVSAFEPLDILHSTAMIMRQLREGRWEVENQYTRVVRREGNPRALAAIEETMELRETFEWRGLGSIPQSALRLRPEFAEWDAEVRYELPGVRVEDPKACQCGEVLIGAIKPWECRVFGTACTPERPIGTCMVSSEGACAAYYAYGLGAAPREPVPA
jgi:hydrogenase expression/formation protein HypD